MTTARKKPGPKTSVSTSKPKTDIPGAVDPEDLSGPHQTPAKDDQETPSNPDAPVASAPKNPERKAMSEPAGNENTMSKEDADKDKKAQQEAKADPASQVIVNPTEQQVAPGTENDVQPEYVEPLKGKSPKSNTKHVQKLVSIDLNDETGRPEPISVVTDDVIVSVEDLRGRPVVKIWQVGMIGVEPIVVLAEKVDEVRRAFDELDDLAEKRLGEERGKRK
jgi:hypothetical protein